ncbi:hypothetical protein ACA910_005853 [Epithemia clementina (nom. ined.)]
MERRSSRKRSLLDQMQLVAEEHESEELSLSFRGSVVDGVDFFADERPVVGDDDDDDCDDSEEDRNMAQVFQLIEAPNLGPTIYEGEEETSEDDDEEDLHEAEVVSRRRRQQQQGGGKDVDPSGSAAIASSTAALDPLYEEGEIDEDDEEQSMTMIHDASFYYDDNQESMSSANLTAEGGDNLPPGYAAKRSSSFIAVRRSIRSNDSSSEHLSINSLPNPAIFSELLDEDAPSQQQQRQHRRSGTEIPGSRSSSKRRSNFHRQSIVVPEGGSSIVEGDGFNATSSLDSSSSSGSPRRLGRMMSRAAVLNSHRSSQRRSSNRSVMTGDASSAGGSSNNIDIATAVDRLESSIDMEGTNWEHTLAAAAIVAAENAPGTKRQTKQYSADDHVLVLLGLLNLQNHGVDDPMNFTISPVNELGYPQGKGRTEQQKQGPFNYLICTVTVVHFDEDERYYTVRRGDTGSEQRADPSVMRPITDPVVIEMAFRAAQRTRSNDPDSPPRVDEHPFKKHLRSFREWPIRFYKKKLIPWYRKTQSRVKVVSARVKVVSTHLLHGDTGYAFKVRLTGINFLVLCSFIYLFNEVFTLAFLPSSWDYKSAVIGLIVWIVLFLELLFECLMRPENYKQLIKSDKAYAPSTARSINTFHLVFESAALFLYIPQFPCVYNIDNCGDDTFFGYIYAAEMAITSREIYRAAFGRVILGLTFLRLFGLVRHWKHMWLTNVFENDRSNSRVVRRVLMMGADNKSKKRTIFRRSNKKRDDDDEESVEDYGGEKESKSSNEDQDLKNAANIGTALMTVNAHRVLVLILVIGVVFPAIYAIQTRNYVNEEMIDLLAANNVAANTTDQCDYLYNAVVSWLGSNTREASDQRKIMGAEISSPVIWAQLLPVRCGWQRSDGVITDCSLYGMSNSTGACVTWAVGPTNPDDATRDYFADTLGLRVGELQEHESSQESDFQSVGNETMYSVKSINDLSGTVTSAMTSLFSLQVTMLVAALCGLTVMRGDAGRLVLDPLQRMLKIVVRYAENPLSRTLSGKKKGSGNGQGRKSVRGNSAEQLGSYETDQLINAIAKIADLLRKCWGVAGAGIISSNLARTKDGKTAVFNPTVPGKRVYALFGFVAIREFDMMLRALKGDVMVLINDVARVVHDEVFRWSLGDSGQCNKNLGAAFLMVFRIGDFSEVHNRKKQATTIVFDSNVKGRNGRVKKRRGSGTAGQTLRASASRRPTMTKFELGANGTLQLASLPGIQLFTDRALLGLLKSYAGILRDEKIVRWNKDFRLGAGVGLFSVSIIYGMDAGWAVEGAVGSNYKIDATYLSPHVNMASRMMSASKQYGVTILLSQAVEELLSKPAQSKLRHLDTVIVKGASRPQGIYTYDARAEGTNFFLFDRPGDRADLEAEAYTSALWDTDQDLKAMRQHVNDNFMKKFKRGVDMYISGEWKSAIEILKEADNIMLQTVIEEAWIDVTEFGDSVFDSQTDDEEITRLRNRYGDGACKNLIQYMERRKAIPPPDWRGFRALMSK